MLTTTAEKTRTRARASRDIWSALPEIQPQYSDALWTVADHKTTVNPAPPNTTVVLYAGDYFYHTGNILWRAHFSATGAEKRHQRDQRDQREDHPELTGVAADEFLQCIHGWDPR